MSYFQEIDSWLDELLFEFIGPSDEQDSNDEEFRRIKKEISAKILESYRNGQKAGLAPAKPTTSADTRAKSNGDRGFRSHWKRNGRQ